MSFKAWTMGMGALLAQACISIPNTDLGGCIEECRLEEQTCMTGNEVDCPVGDACMDDIELCFDTATDCSKGCTGCEDEPGGCFPHPDEDSCADHCADLANSCTDLLRPCIDAKEECLEAEVDADKECLDGEDGLISCLSVCSTEAEEMLKSIGD